RIDRCGARAVAVAKASGKAVAIADPRAELDELLDGRDPLHLNAVLGELTTEQRLVRERRTDEIPGVLMLLVEIADAGEEPAELGYHAIGQRRHQAIRLLDRHGVLRRKRHREIAREIRIDGGSERKLRFAEAQPAPAGAHLIGFLESRDRVLPRV